MNDLRVATIRKARQSIFKGFDIGHFNEILRKI